MGDVILWMGGLAVLGGGAYWLWQRFYYGEDMEPEPHELDDKIIQPDGTEGTTPETSLTNLSHPTEAMERAVKGQEAENKQEKKPTPKNALNPTKPPKM